VAKEHVESAQTLQESQENGDFAINLEFWVGALPMVFI
jgi:hypothetical protein